MIDDATADRIDQIQRDLHELEVQIADGDIDRATGDRLRATYRSEWDAIEAAASQVQACAASRSGRRTLAGAVVLVAALAISVGVAGQFVQQRDVGAIEGVADLEGTTDLSSVSDEAMLAVIEAYADDPAVADQIPRMRFALAERKFDDQEYAAAFDQYEAILSAQPPPPAELAAPTLTRISWIVWLNGEDDLALRTVERSLELVPGDAEAEYVQAQILWCGDVDPQRARTILSDLVDQGSLPDEVSAQIGADLAAIEAGQGCAP